MAYVSQVWFANSCGKMHFGLDFFGVYPYDSNKHYVIIASGNRLMSNRRHTITWTDEKTQIWRNLLSLARKEYRFSTTFES